MSVLQRIMDELDETYVIDHVFKPHDEARMQYRLSDITVSDDIEFDDAIADYYNYHFTECISRGGSLNRAEAAGRAKEILEREYRRRNKNILDAYVDGKTGRSGGMRAILDIIMEHLKNESYERHFRDVLDRYIARTSFDERLELASELISILDKSGVKNIDTSRPEKYAHDYEELTRLFVENQKTLSSFCRRL